MKQRPEALWKYALALAIIGFLIPIQVIFERHLFGSLTWKTFLANFTTLDGLVFSLTLAQALFIHLPSPFILASTPSLFLCLAWYAWTATTHVAGGEPRALIEILIAFAGLGLQIPFFLRPDFRSLFLNPNLRWWRTAVRWKKEFKVIVRPVLGGELQAATVDLSVSGALISTQQTKWSHLQQVNPEYISTGMRCSVKLILSHLHSMQCSAEIVRCVDSTGIYPAGFAVRFVSMDPQQKKLLNSYLVEPALRSSNSSILGRFQSPKSNSGSWQHWPKSG